MLIEKNEADCDTIYIKDFDESVLDKDMTEFIGNAIKQKQGDFLESKDD